MGKVSILVMWPWPFEGPFVPPGMMDAYLNYKLANEPSAKMAAKWIGIKHHCFLLLPANNFLQ